MAMKKVIIAFLLSFSSLISFSQANSDSSKHLTFKGVPLDGTLDQYVNKMKQAGFSHLSTAHGIAMLKGDFAGYKDCIVGVSTLKQKDLVHKIGVIFSEKDTWSTLSSNYFNLKDMLIQKYGNPTEIVEKFDTRTEPKDDNSRMYEVKFDRCKYYSIWESEKGQIQLSIEHNSVISCFIKLLYLDRINNSAMRQKALDDL